MDLSHKKEGMMRFLVFTMTMLLVTSVHAEDAARSWGSSMGFSSPSQQAVDFNRAHAEYLLNKNRTPGVVVNNTGDTNNTSTRLCQVAGACQDGGSSTNVNGYSSITIEGTGNTVGVDIDAQSKQNATTVPMVSDTIGTITFN